MPRAEITYNAGASYRIKRFVFKRDKTQLVEDAQIIDRCRKTAGFTVMDLPEEEKLRPPPPKTVKKVKKVVKATTAPAEKKPKPTD